MNTIVIIEMVFEIINELISLQILFGSYIIKPRNKYRYYLIHIAARNLWDVKLPRTFTISYSETIFYLLLYGLLFYTSNRIALWYEKNITWYVFIVCLTISRFFYISVSSKLSNQANTKLTWSAPDSWASFHL